MSHSEGWGMTITEAAASGTPCVVTDNIGHRGAVVDKLTGLLVADDAQFAQTIARVLGDSAMWGAMSAAALAHSHSFSWDACAEKILQVIHHEVLRHAADA
jgi:glycosyltransferase involved in cell wall biosynthesis